MYLKREPYGCYSSGYHFPLDARSRIASLLGGDSFVEKDVGVRSLDPLKFNATAKYTEKLKASQAKTKETDAVIDELGSIGGVPVSIAVMDFRFMGASLGSAAGEKITRAIERGLKEKCAVIIISASGGARMQGGDSQPHAACQNQCCPCSPQRSRTSLHFNSNKPHDGRRHGQLCLTG